MNEETKDMPKVSSDMEAPKALNYIEKLVAELCPDGVEYVKLGDVTTSVQKIKWNEYPTQEFAYIDLSSIPTGGIEVKETSTISSYNAPSRAQQILRKNDVLFGVTRPLLKRVYKVSSEYDGQICSTGYLVLRANVNMILPGYIYHIIRVNNFYKYVEKHQSGSAYPAISGSLVKEYIVPLPPIKVQNAIVEILDKFTKLEAELEAELAARRAQYEYYRNSLFENLSGGGSEILGNLVKIKNGKSYKGFNSGDIPVYGSGGIMTYIDRSAYTGPSVLIPRKGSLGNIFYVDTPFWNVDTIFYTEINREQVTPKYLYHALQVQNLSELNTAGGVPSLTQTVLKRVRIPLPSLAEQECIVKILDKFDALVNDISSGLPAEIEARRKQYEYYRDRLLTFPRASEATEHKH
ncbi:restriction endonuclease subunit S [Rothia dentocariosa]|uniref:restriction endonuclease subunit S n=1 Tax=Rothia dentocariosa TaxID=2047 RepID=UPI0028DB2221|nr:restriction endonuclease subunit S [Rothia dentocariosa]